MRYDYMDFWISAGLLIIGLLFLVMVVFLLLYVLRMVWSAVAVYLTSAGTVGIPCF
jgi:membrane protein implicated in regulation of membrane protease activity